MAVKNVARILRFEVPQKNFKLGRPTSSTVRTNTSRTKADQGLISKRPKQPHEDCPIQPWKKLTPAKQVKVAKETSHEAMGHFPERSHKAKKLEFDNRQLKFGSGEKA